MTVSKLATVSKYGWQRGGNFGQIARKPIDKIVLHHNAGTGCNVVPECWVGRQASAHYQIESGTIISCLDEDITGWHCGASGVDNNSHTIGIEHQNSTGAPDWKVSPENQEKSAQLIAEICQRRGIPIDRNHIVRHREMPNCQTACSGGLDIDWIVNRAREIAGQSNVTTNTPKENKEEEIMKIITITTDGSYYGKNYKAGACFYFTGDSIRYIERPATLEAFNILGIPYHKLNAIQFLYLIQDLDLKII